MLGVAVLSYWYFHRLRQLPRHLAALAAIGVGATPAFVFLATSTVMSECVFTLAQLGAVAVAHRAIDEPAERTRLAIVAALLGAATVLIRSVGVGVVAAVFLCFVKERQWKRASVFAVVVALFVAPWLLYTRAHAPDRRAPADSSRLARLWIRRAILDAMGRIGHLRQSNRRRFTGSHRHQSGRYLRPKRWRHIRSRAAAAARRERRRGRVAGGPGLLDIRGHRGAACATWRFRFCCRPWSCGVSCAPLASGSPSQRSWFPSRSSLRSCGRSGVSVSSCRSPRSSICISSRGSRYRRRFP